MEKAKITSKEVLEGQLKDKAEEQLPLHQRKLGGHGVSMPYHNNFKISSKTKEPKTHILKPK